MPDMSERATVLIVAVILIVIGLSLVPTVAGESKRCQDDANVTGAADSICGLFPLIFAAGLIITGIGLLFVGAVRGST